MYYILYSSQATSHPANINFRQLLEKCHSHNAAKDITGLLFYHNGYFMQFIEGEKENIRELYAKISKDTRHEQVTTLEEGEQTGRFFPDWAMGFKAAATDISQNMPDFINLNEDQLLFNADSKTQHPALPHLKDFYNQIEADKAQNAFPL